MRRVFITIMTKAVLLLAFLAAYAGLFSGTFQADTLAASSDSKHEQSNDLKGAQSKYSIRDAFKKVMDAMFKYERGLHGEINALYRLIEVPPNIKEDFRDNYLIDSANRLYVILQNIDYDVDEDIPLDAAEDRTKIRLGREDGLQVTFEMVKTPDGGWRFAAKTVDDPNLKALFSQLKARYDKLSRADMEGDTFERDLMSPYRTVRTLFNGVLGRGGYTLQDAVKTLDLSEMDQSVQESLGPFITVALYRILRFRSPLDMSQLSADPQSKRSPILLVDPKYGVISMHVVEDPESGLKQWKFTPISAQVVLDAFEEYTAEGMAKPVQEDSPLMSVKNPPMQIVIDDWMWKHFSGLEREILDLDIWQWLLLLVLLLATPLILKLIRIIINRSCHKLGDLDSKDIKCTHQSLILPLQIATIGTMWFQGIMLVSTNPALIQVCDFLFQIIIVISSVWLSWVIIELLAMGLMGAGQTSVKGTVVLVISRILKITLVVLGLVSMASLFGQDSTRILTAMGIGGVAVALAGKDTVENIFGTFMILSTSPFAIGDWIKVDDFEGTVENVGIRSTALRTFHNSVVNVPNATFIKTPVDNMGKRSYRRYKTAVHIRYDTAPDLIVSFMEGIRELVRSHPHTRKDFHLIRLNDFSHSSLQILIYIFFKTGDWDTELEERERFILDVLRLADLMGIKFAYPTRQLVMAKEKSTESVLPERGEALRLGREAASVVGGEHFKSAG